MIAKVNNPQELESLAKIVNNGRTDGVYFYVNEKNVSVHHAHVVLSKEKQVEELDWFLAKKEYVLIDEQ